MEDSDAKGSLTKKRCIDPLVGGEGGEDTTPFSFCQRLIGDGKKTGNGCLEQNGA